MSSPMISALANEPLLPPTQPTVELINRFDEPYNNAVATARTCYARKIIYSKDVATTAQQQQQRDRIAQSTYQAGHHTTLQHATFQFALQGVSRQFLWSFLHAHPHYNSEQVSQRYVKVAPHHVYIPHNLTKSWQLLYQQAIAWQMTAYEQLVVLLKEQVQQHYFQIFKGRRKQTELYEKEIRKRTQEIARYILPIGTTAHLYHTISGLTLHRYHRLSNMLEVPAETKQIIQAMIKAVDAHDPLFFQFIEDPLDLEETLEYQLLADLQQTIPNPHQANLFCQAFDRKLENSNSKLLQASSNAPQMLADSLRLVMGCLEHQLNNEEALAWLLSPKKNSYLSGALNLQSLSKITRCLNHVHYTFQKKLSHSADSQDQRHRSTPGSRPLLMSQYRGGAAVDAICPKVLTQVPEASDLFWCVLQKVYQQIDILLDSGCPVEYVQYLLPNAFPVRFYESGDLAAWHHKWTTRLCYNAQEEIWQASYNEVQQVHTIHPEIGQYLLPPCALRAIQGIRPTCPEGDHFCGVVVWKQARENYQRLL